MMKVENEMAIEPFRAALLLQAELLAEAAAAAVQRGVPLARILHAEYGVPRQDLIAALSAHYQCAAIEYDERLPIPPELLIDLPDSQLARTGWFPIIKDADGTIVIAAGDPADATMRAEVEGDFRPGPL